MFVRTIDLFILKQYTDKFKVTFVEETMKDRQDYERDVQLIMNVLDELTNTYDIMDHPTVKTRNSLPSGGFGRKNIDGTKKKESLHIDVTITKPTRDDLERIIRSILLKYKFD
ncbi:MAG: hypothetical protein HQ521_06110 [Bacteroidetes bacterium]|nr:hypothetical protein [Bacteroidota bacterium]